MSNLCVIILTKNEQLHIKRCIENVRNISDEIYVIDCYSTDGTQDIAMASGATVIEHEWPGNQADQFNWALDNLNIRAEWIMRIDADEYLMPELIEEIKQKIPYLDKSINGITFKRRHIFLNKWIKRGIYPVKMLRTFRKGHGRCEHRLMDEHILIDEGDIIEFENDFCDHNLNNISWFCKKHVDYAIREAAEMLDIEFNLSKDKLNHEEKGMSPQALKKRKLKLSYSKKPLFWRSAVYFIYRFIFKGGWRDGKEGFIFNFIQGWWYRTLVDSKIFEIKKGSDNDPERIRTILLNEYGIKL